MGWRVLYIEESEYLSLYLDNIKIKHNDNEIMIPITDVHTLILDNYKINLSVHLINALTKANVNLVICGIDHLPQTIVLPHDGSKLSFPMLKKQLKWDYNLKSQIQKFIVKNKITNQKKLLKHFNRNNDDINLLSKYINEVQDKDVTNREGLAAKVYFRALFGKDFIRFEKDIINAGLNYGYSILRSQISKVLVSKGLNTSIAFFHVGRDNEFNLSDDIIESFRPIIDHYVYNTLMKESIFKKEHRHDLIKQTTKTVIIDGKKQTIFNAIKIYTEAILDFCETKNYNSLKEINIDYNEL